MRDAITAIACATLLAGFTGKAHAVDQPPALAPAPLDESRPDRSVVPVEPVDAADEAAPPEPEIEVKGEEPERSDDAPPGYADAPQAGDVKAAPKAMRAANRADDHLIPGDSLDEEEAAELLEREVDPQVAQIEQQYLSHFRPVMKAELAFMFCVCDPSLDERKRLVESGERCLKLAVRKYALEQHRRRQGQRVFGRRPSVQDPRQSLPDQIASLARDTLSTEQIEQYEYELRQRETSRRRAAVLSIVAALDELLVLTAEQREQLTEKMLANWRDEWENSLQALMFQDGYFPPVSEPIVLPLLTKAQKKVWRNNASRQVIHAGLPFGGGIRAANFIIHDVNFDLLDVEVMEVEEKGDEEEATTEEVEENG